MHGASHFKKKVKKGDACTTSGNRAGCRSPPALSSQDNDGHRRYREVTLRSPPPHFWIRVFEILSIEVFLGGWRLQTKFWASTYSYLFNSLSKFRPWEHTHSLLLQFSPLFLLVILLNLENVVLCHNWKKTLKKSSK